MIRREFVDWIRGIETELPVTEWRVRDIHVWPLVRLSLYSSTFQSGSPEHSLGAGWRRLGGNVARGLEAWARAWSGDASANRSPGSLVDAVFLGSSLGRRPLVDGKRYDVRAGPFVALIEAQGARAAVWEMSPFGDYNIPRHTPSFFVQPTLIRLRALCQVLPLGEDRVVLPRFDDFLARVSAAGLSFAHGDVMRIRRDVLFLRRLSDRFRIWLRQARPRLGFVANTGLPEQAFCLACHELGITSVEVQHGVQGDLHPSYGSWFAVPADGWETRARVFWSWDEESAAAINRWASCAPDRHVAIVGGDPWREMWMDDGDLGRRSDRLVDERKRASGGERHILVTLSSQGEVIPAAVLEAVGSSPPEWRYWFRLHPVNQATRLQEARRMLGSVHADLELLTFATEVPLHALLRRMDAHLSVSLSTVITEAAAHGVASVACGVEARDFYRAELEGGMLLVATTPREILDAVRRVVLRGRVPVIPAAPSAPAAMARLLGGQA